MLEHASAGPSFTIGIEEELMILDPEGWTSPRRSTGWSSAVPDDVEGQVKPELMQVGARDRDDAVRDVSEAGRQLADLRAR